VWQHYAKSSTIWLFLSLFWKETSFIVILPMMILFGKKTLGLSCSSRLLGNRHTTGELSAKIELVSGGRALGRESGTNVISEFPTQGWSTSAPKRGAHCVQEVRTKYVLVSTYGWGGKEHVFHGRTNKEMKQASKLVVVNKEVRQKEHSSYSKPRYKINMSTYHHIANTVYLYYILL
jgi:hypothetical protein